MQILILAHKHALCSDVYDCYKGYSLFQVIICTKEVSVGARKSAYNLLVEIGSAFVRFCGNTKGDIFILNACRQVCLLKFWPANCDHEVNFSSDLDAMDQYLVLVYAGLTGSVTMITCTVLALTRLVFEYRGKPSDTQHFPGAVLKTCAESFCCFFPPRLHPGVFLRAAAAQCLSAAVVSYQRDCQSCFRFHEGHLVHHGSQDAGLTCHSHGMNSVFLLLPVRDRHKN